MRLEGVWLPIITPFLKGEVDYDSYTSLIDYYIDKGINGIIPLGTTGECPAIEDYEFEKIIEVTVDRVNNRLPVFIGVGGNYTKKVVKQVKLLDKYNVQGILSVCPYYNRPDQKGIYEHFKKISENTDKNIIIYNIPYRTGRNIENSTIFRLAELKNITGIKDSCGDIKQSMELLTNKPENFSVLTGEDILYYLTLTLGGEGGILAAAHVKTEKYINIYNLIKKNKHKEALSIWRDLLKIVPLLFKEPNPAPIKYILNKMDLINSSETRLPLTDITVNLKKEIDNIVLIEY